MLMRSAHASSIELSASLMPSVTSTRNSGVSTSPSNTAGGASLKPSVEIETIDAAQAATTPVLSQVPQGMTDAAPTANAVLANTAPTINAVPADAAPTMNAAVADTAPAVTTAPVDTTPADIVMAETRGSKTRHRVNPLVKALGVPVGPTKSSDSSSQPQVKLVNQRLPRRRGKDVTGIAAEPAKK
ncbi:hypothetical protein BDZ97DRAFT_425042 [Flammula alnicola]|nr:hypothetical protein BDZ97DRAFT_425042 [Flammula alnicola]